MKAMAPHSSTLAWKIPWAGEPGGLQSMQSLRVGQQLSDFTFTFHFHALEKEMATHSSVLAWRVPGMGEPGGLPSMGSHRVGHDWSDLAAEQIISQFVWKYKNPRIAKPILRKNGTGGINLPNFRLYCKATVIKKVWYWNKEKYRSMEQNRKPRDKSTHLWTPYLWQRSKNIKWIKDNLFNKWRWESWSTMCKRMKLEHFLTP